MEVVWENLYMFFDIRKINSIAQVTSEYAIILAIIVAVLASMQIYIKRGVQAKLMDATDYPVRSGVFRTGQFEPGYAASNRSDIRGSTTREFMSSGLAITRQKTETLRSNITSVISNTL